MLEIQIPRGGATVIWRFSAALEMTGPVDLPAICHSERCVFPFALKKLREESGSLDETESASHTFAAVYGAMLIFAQICGQS